MESPLSASTFRRLELGLLRNVALKRSAVHAQNSTWSVRLFFM